MNQIRAIQALNKREIENGISPEASWHTDYRDTAFINFGGLPYELSEGDIVTIFSQYGEPTFVKLARDKETGKSKGFGWLKYEDQRSCDLAVDNLGGAEIGGRLVRVDHARYRARDDEDPAEFAVGWEDLQRKEQGGDVEMRNADSESDEEEEEKTERRPMIREERELQKLIEEHDEDDPMKSFLIDEKKKEVERALRKGERGNKRHKHRHHHHHRSHRRSPGEEKSDGERDGRKKRSRRDETPVAKDRSGRDGDGTPERKIRDYSRDRERKNRDDDRDRRRDKGRRRDREERDSRGERRSRHEGTAERERERGSSKSKSKRRSRSRSPAYRN